MKIASPIASVILVALFVSLTSACGDPGQTSGPIPVEIRKVDGRVQMYRDGEPYTILGAGLERPPYGEGDMAQLAAHGANSVRTWRTDSGDQPAQVILDQALELGLTVTMGIEIGRERSGSGGIGVFDFDYDDEVAVAQQLEQVKQEVLKYKDHPSIIIWGIGNELNLGATNPKVWDAVNDISKMIHEVDPHHLTTTMLAGIGKDLADQINERAPDLDLIGIQMYADIENLPRYLKEIGWDRPYMVTEWGATGHWEVPTTSWGAPIENNSSVKADAYARRYQIAIASDTTHCVGSYVFLWGQKQERTPTWYGMALPNGDRTEAMDVMQHAWTGSWPANRTPRLEEALLDGKTAYDNVMLKAGQTYPAEVMSTDPDGDTLTYFWEVMRETTDLGHGGDLESVPERLDTLVAGADQAQVTLTAPNEPGAYRLFVYVYDGQGHGAHANIPFFVNE